MSRRRKSAGISAAAEPDQANVEHYRVAVSARIWIVLAVLAGLLVASGTGLFISRAKLAKARANLAQAQLKIRESDLMLKNALADKELVMKELASQGSIIAQSSRGEEQARAKLAAISSDAESAEKRIAALTAEVKALKARLAKTRKAAGSVRQLKEDVTALTLELEQTRGALEQTRSELDRLRATTEPYRAGQGQRQ